MEKYMKNKYITRDIMLEYFLLSVYVILYYTTASGDCLRRKFFVTEGRKSVF
jgi:hypothetical protein